jgi:hypothetical protein
MLRYRFTLLHNAQLQTTRTAEAQLARNDMSVQLSGDRGDLAKMKQKRARPKPDRK